MRLPQPHDLNGRLCLPTHHHRSRLRWRNSPTPTSSSRPRPRICSPTCHHPRPASPSWPPPPAHRHPGHGCRRGADLIRGHPTIENGLDGSQVRTGTAPQVMACLRNLVIGALCRAGPVNLAVALRHHSRAHTDHLPPSASAFDETNITQQHRSPGRGPAVIPWGGLRKVRD
jgi:hypothetical protein